MRNNEFKIDRKALVSTMKSLNKILPYDSKTQTAIANGMKDASKPLVNTLKKLIRENTGKGRDKDLKSTGRLARSIKTFRAKRLDKFKRPSVYVGPRIKAPRTKKMKDPKTKAAWYKKWSGYYFYFLEYGFSPFGNDEIKRSGLGLLPKTVQASGGATLGLLRGKIIARINKNIKKQGLSFK